MTLLLPYLTSLRDLRATGAGVAKISYYPALSALLDSVGASLSPAVRRIS